MMNVLSNVKRLWDKNNSKFPIVWFEDIDKWAKEKIENKSVVDNKTPCFYQPSGQTRADDLTQSKPGLLFSK